MVGRFRRRLRLTLVTVLLGLACLGITMGGSERARSFVAESAIADIAINRFNAVRPSLNWGNNDRCIDDLVAVGGVRVERVADRTEALGCRLDHVVRVSGRGAMFAHPITTTCSLAHSLRHFEADLLQPLARKHLGQSIRGIRHLGTYSCRPMRGKTRLLSEHAFANAIDIAACELADGSEVNVERDWRDSVHRHRQK